MLSILLRHIHSDAVLYSLQTLANLVNHAAVRTRFREGRCVNFVVELLRADEMDELVLGAISAFMVVLH
jgi:hypothetical protein